MNLPKDWGLKSLGVISLNKGQYGSGAKKTDFDGRVRYIRITDIDDDGKLKNDDIVSPSVLEEEYFLENEDLLFARSGSVGRTYLHEIENGKYQYAGYLIRYKINKSIAIPKYVFYVTRSSYYFKWIESIKKSSTLSNINAREYSSFEIPLPFPENSYKSLEVQKQIVSILGRAEKLKEKRQKANEETNKIIQSIFYDMFGDPVKNGKGWKVHKLSEVGTLNRGKSKHRPRDAPELLGGPYPLIQTGDVANSGGYIKEYHQTYSELGLKQSKMWPKNTLCITIAANIAKTAILTFDSCFPDSIVGFIPNEKARTEYVHAWFSFIQKKLEDFAPQSAQKNINLNILSNLDIPTPPITLQDKFVNTVKKLESLKEKQKQSTEEINTLFDALMQKAFKGELVN